MKPQVKVLDITEAPNLQVLKDRFGVDEKDLIVAYGDAIYAPNKTLSYDLLAHELKHCERQRYDRESAERWWQKYYEDVDFRLKEELVAYATQYAYCKKVFKDRNKQVKILFALASELASSRYGNIITQHDAMREIKNMV